MSSLRHGSSTIGSPRCSRPKRSSDIWCGGRFPISEDDRGQRLSQQLPSPPWWDWPSKPGKLAEPLGSRHRRRSGLNASVEL
jgi:hypothetical protein